MQSRKNIFNLKRVIQYLE